MLSAEVALAGRTLIVNADDFGRSPGINAGVVRAHLRGIVTTCSLMVRWPSADYAARSALAMPRLDVGLHLDLGEWQPHQGSWRAVYELVNMDDPEAVEHEVRAQLHRFRELLGRDPTHLDSHQHVHRQGAAAAVAAALAQELDIPVRGLGEAAYCGAFYGQAHDGSPYPEGIALENLIQILRQLPEGITELGCHPGEHDTGENQYRSERTVELDRLCSPYVRAVVEQEQIELRSFSELRAAARS